MSDTDAARLDALLELDPRTRRTAFDELKRPAGAATVSRLREHLTHLGWLDRLGETEAWLEGVPPAKVAHFAGQARATDAGDLRRVGDPKRQVLIACLLHLARVRARDDVVTMFCKRIAALHTKARQRLEALREQHRADSERLIAVFGDVLGVVRAALDDDRAAGEPPGVVCERAGRRVLDALAAAGGVEELTSTQEAVAAHHGDNWLALLERPYRSHRAVLFTLLDALELEPTSVDRRVLDAVAFLQANRRRTGELISDQLGDARLDLSFASEAWQRLVRDPQRPDKLVRRHLETCVFSYLAAELRSGDIAVAGSESYANFRDQLLTVQECAPLVAGYCAEAGLPSNAGAFTAALRRQLEQVAAGVDAGYPHNADLVIGEHGRPTLRRRRGKDRRPSALALERAILDRLPERGLLDILARTAHFVGWQRHFGPASGSDPKLSDALGRYVLLAFCYGTNLGPSQVARHMRGTVTARELTIASTHAPADKIHAGSTDVINAYSALDLPALWGDGASAGVDGTQVDTWENNVLAETSIRYGGYGGIAYRRISDTYIALFSHFIPCGVWEAVYLIEGLLRNDSAVQPEVIHGDTQSQSLPVFGLAHMLGFELLPRIRNWADLILYRPNRDTRYEHIDALFASDAVIDWNLIETHWPDLVRVALSIREGRISSATLLRRLGHDSRRNRLYRAFRELGRVVRTIVLLRYLSEPELRDGIAIMTNRVEAFHGFSDWLMFGGAVLADNDPDHHERIVKFNELLANCAIYHTTRDITAAANQLLADGWTIDPDDLATIAPYLTRKIRRFGEWTLDTSPPADTIERLALTAPASDNTGYRK